MINGEATTALAACDVAAVCSGTATLQAALIGRPMVVFYKLSWLSFQILRLLVKVDNVALVNLIAERPLIRELIQHDFTVDNLYRELHDLLSDKQRRDELQRDLLALRAKLGSRKASLEVAGVVAGYLPPAQTVDPADKNV